MIKLEKTQLIIILIICTCIAVLLVFTCHSPIKKFDHTVTDELQQAEKQLQLKQLQLDSISGKMQDEIDEAKKFDSTLQNQYENKIIENQLLQQQLKDRENEKIKHINSFDSDSLRRAYAE